MTIKQHKATVFGKQCTLRLMHFDSKDRKKWKYLFDLWKNLKTGLRDYKCREPNFPEGLSEVAFCLFTGSKRLISVHGPVSASFDTFNLKKGHAEQIKACSVERDLSSFGPTSKWDKIYFLDFYNKGKLDGAFNIYEIPSKIIYKVKVNKKETFKDQQLQKRRPRFSIMDKIIKPRKLKPMGANIKVWQKN